MMCPLNANDMSFKQNYVLQPISLYEEGILQKKKCRTQMICPLNANDVSFKRKWCVLYTQWRPLTHLLFKKEILQKKLPNANDVSFLLNGQNFESVFSALICTLYCWNSTDEMLINPYVNETQPSMKRNCYVHETQPIRPWDATVAKVVDVVDANGRLRIGDMTAVYRWYDGCV